MDPDLIRTLEVDQVGTNSNKDDREHQLGLNNVMASEGPGGERPNPPTWQAPKRQLTEKDCPAKGS